MSVKINKPSDIEILCEVRLSKEKFPIAYEAKVEELMEENGLTREKAEEAVEGMEITLEIYYEKSYGLFAVESEAVECVTIYSPYTGEPMEE